MILWILILVPALSLAIHAWGTWLTLRRLQTKDEPGSQDLPPISILKPLKGCDSGLYENLRSFFFIDYPDYELIFSIKSSADPAWRIVRKLMRRFPQVKSRIVIEDLDLTCNPKVNNLLRSWRIAENDWILISDSNVRVESGYLRSIACHLSPDVGVVTATVEAIEAKSAGGYLESIYLNTFYMRVMGLASAVEQTCVLGKSMILSRSSAERFGGIRALGAFLAEDFMSGELMRKLGKKIILMNAPVQQYIGSYTLREYWNRHVRWGRIRKSHNLFAFMAEGLSQGLITALSGAAALHSVLEFDFAAGVGLIFGLWALCDLLVLSRLRTPLQVWMPLAWFAREILALPLWIYTLMGDTVTWRGETLRILPGGILHESTSSLDALSLGSGDQQPSD